MKFQYAILWEMFESVKIYIFIFGTGLFTFIISDYLGMSFSQQLSREMIGEFIIWYNLNLVQSLLDNIYLIVGVLSSVYISLTFTYEFDKGFSKFIYSLPIEPYKIFLSKVISILLYIVVSLVISYVSALYIYYPNIFTVMAGLLIQSYAILHILILAMILILFELGLSLALSIYFRPLYLSLLSSLTPHLIIYFIGARIEYSPVKIIKDAFDYLIYKELFQVITEKYYNMSYNTILFNFGYLASAQLSLLIIILVGFYILSYLILRNKDLA